MDGRDCLKAQSPLSSGHQPFGPHDHQLATAALQVCPVSLKSSEKMLFTHNPSQHIYHITRFLPVTAAESP